MRQAIDSDRHAVERETALVRIEARGSEVAAVIASSAQAGARVLDAIGSTFIIEITDSPDRVTAFIDRVRAFGIIDLARSGPVVLPRATATSTPHPVTPSRRSQPSTSTWASYLMPVAPAPFTSQADGASDDVAA